MKTTSTKVQSESGNQILAHVGECLYRSLASGVYYAVIKRGCRQVKRSLRTKDRKIAKARLEEHRLAVARLDTNTNGNSLSFNDLAARWLQAVGSGMKAASLRRRKSAVGSLARHFKMSVRSIGKQDVEYWASIRAKERSARTFNIERETLILVLEYAVREGLRLENPAKIIHRQKEPKRQIVIPTQEQFKTLIATIRTLDPRAHESADLVEFLAYSGCRLKEATEMRWGDINNKQQQFTVTGGEGGTKNHEQRSVPLFHPLEQLLRRMRDRLSMPPMAIKRIFRIENAKTAIIAACKQAGLPHMLHHSMRHFFCSNAIEAGIDFKAIAVWLGHKDGGILVAKTYGHLRDEHSRTMAKRMTFDATTPLPKPENVVSFHEAGKQLESHDEGAAASTPPPARPAVGQD